MSRARFVLPLALVFGAAAAPGQAPSPAGLDAFVRAQMARRHIHGLSLAIVQDGKIVTARAYGVRDTATGAPVTTATLFQAGSISKPVSALGALHLVAEGKLSLDGEVNGFLTSWKVPANAFTATQPVTLRRLLSHNAGVTVHGFPGYDVDSTLPTLVQVLDGAPPANTPPIRVDTTPGAIWRYSGGGFTIAQQMMIDVTKTPFPRFLGKTVLAPIGMTASSFDQPLPPARAALTASGYYSDRSAVRGRWHVYPEMAAAGLWTTPSDLARFAIEIQETLAGHGHGVISPTMARQYLTEQIGGSGLGIGVSGTGRDWSFSHGGRDEGFDALLIGFATTGQGAAIMINANDNSRFMSRILSYIARAYGWPQAAVEEPAATTAASIDRSLVGRYAGRYEMAENEMLALLPDESGTGLQTFADGLPDETFLPLDSATFGSAERALRFTFLRDAAGAITLDWRPGEGPREHRAPRIGPLPSAMQPSPDPDAALTARIAGAIDALRAGGAALAAAPTVTAGARLAFGRGADPALNGLGALTYLGETRVAGHGIRRHGGEVAVIRFYRPATTGAPKYLLVHLTADGMVTDYDVVDR